MYDWIGLNMVNNKKTKKLALLFTNFSVIIL